jgi:hypothetical protein
VDLANLGEAVAAVAAGDHRREAIDEASAGRPSVRDGDLGGHHLVRASRGEAVRALGDELGDALGSPLGPSRRLVVGVGELGDAFGGARPGNSGSGATTLAISSALSAARRAPSGEK